MDVIVQEHFHEGDMETFWRHGKKRVALNCRTFKRLDKYAESLSCEHGNGMTPTIVLFSDKRKIVPFV